MKKKLLLILCLFCSSLASAQYKAVVCGISNYPTSTYGKYCNADAKAVAHHLANLPNWGGANITLLTDQSATKAAINNAIDNMVASAQSGDVFIFFFSGRSAANLVCAYDGDITFNELATRIAYMPTGNYAIFIDMGVPRGGIFQAPLTPIHYAGTTSQGISVLSYYEYLGDPLYEVAKNSPFAYLLLEALSGYGQADYDGFITAQECADYINLHNGYIITTDNTAGVPISTTNIAMIFMK